MTRSTMAMIELVQCLSKMIPEIIERIFCSIPKLVTKIFAPKISMNGFAEVGEHPLFLGR